MSNPVSAKTPNIPATSGPLRGSTADTSQSFYSGAAGLSSLAVSRPIHDWKTERIAVIDDEEIIADCNAEMFEMLAPAAVHKLHQTTQDAEAIANFVLSNNVSTLITDNDMHGVKGFDVIREIMRIGGEQARNISFVIYSGLAAERQKELEAVNADLKSAGCKLIELVGKPVNFDRLAEAARKAWLN